MEQQCKGHTPPCDAHFKGSKGCREKVLLIEACAREMDAYCDETILIRPGTDGALALAMMHVLEEKGLADEVFLRERCEGYEAFCRL